MFKNYIKTAFRSLLRHRFFSAINIIGLAVAMSIGMVIIMLVADQMESDRYNSKRDRIYRVITVHVNDQGVEDGSEQNAASSFPLRQELKEKYSGIEYVVRIQRGFGNNWLELEHQNVNVPLAGFFADAEIFELFELTFSIASITRQITKRKYLLAFLSSAIVISTALIILAMELYPIVIHSTGNEKNSLDIYNSAASEKSLEIMLLVAAIGVPLVAAYTTFVFWTFKGKVKLDETSY